MKKQRYVCMYVSKPLGEIGIMEGGIGEIQQTSMVIDDWVRTEEEKHI